jgi:ATP-dependent RNA helicase DeaD
LAVTLVTPREIGHLHLIEQVAKRRIFRKPLPTLTDALAGQQRITMDKILRILEDEDILRYKGLAEELLESYDSISLLSAALKLLTKEPSTTPVMLTEESPLRSRQPRRDRVDSSRRDRYDPSRRDRFDQPRRERPEQPSFHRKRENKYITRAPKH